MITRFVRAITPQTILRRYHLLLAVLARVYYRNPSKELVVIGVTGTKGKSTTCNMLWQILTEAGQTVGMTTTVNIRIGEMNKLNDTKMTMQGRFRLQKLLRQMIDAGCTYAIVETSSEGIKQHRNHGIDYQVAVFTNLSPEHIESHGSFENYKQAKGELFNGLTGKSISVVNADSEYANYFLSFPAYEHVTFGINNEQADINATGIQTKAEGSYFLLEDQPIHVPLLGAFNITNAAAAASAAYALQVPWRTIAAAFKKITVMPGRMERFESSRGFVVVVDYAHTVESLEMVYQTLKPLGKRLIAVHGACGGGRDKAKRPLLGKMTAQYADVAIITNEDPYDEDPQQIIDAVWEGLVDFKGEKHQILDREEAIKQALELAKEDDVVVVTGKGSEQRMATRKGLVDWDDRRIVKQYLS